MSWIGGGVTADSTVPIFRTVVIYLSGAPGGLHLDLSRDDYQDLIERYDRTSARRYVVEVTDLRRNDKVLLDVARIDAIRVVIPAGKEQP